MLRVAFDHQIFTMQEYGGISRYFARIAEELPHEGVQVKIIAPFHVNATVAALPPGHAWGWKLPAGRVQMAFARRASAALFPIVSLPFGPDIVHETYYSRRPGRRRGRGPIVLTVYDMIHELFPELYAQDRTAELKAAAVRRADKILCISENTRADLLRFHPEVEGKAVVTLLGFDPPLPETASRPKGNPGAKPYLLFVGPRRGYKNFEGLLKAVSASPVLKSGLDLICVGGGSFRQSEAEMIQRLALAGQVRQVNADDAALQALYRSASAFVYPSLYEGFGIPPLEAMALDCPVVCMRTSSVSEVCGEAASYAEPGDEASLREAIESVVTSEERAAGLRAAGRDRIKHFSWRRCAQDTARVYRDIS